MNRHYFTHTLIIRSKTIFYLVIGSFFFLFCSSPKNPDPEKIPQVTFESFVGKSLAVIPDGFSTLIATQLKANPVTYRDGRLASENLHFKAVDGFLSDLTILNYYHAHPNNEVFLIVEIPRSMYETMLYVISSDSKQITNFNNFLKRVERNGFLDTLQSNWFGIFRDSESSDEIEYTGYANGILRVAISADTPPFSYIANNGLYIGYSIELLEAYSANEQKKIEFQDLKMNDIKINVISKKVDLAIINQLALPEESRERILFSDPLYHSSLGIMYIP